MSVVFFVQLRKIISDILHFGMKIAERKMKKIIVTILVLAYAAVFAGDSYAQLCWRGKPAPDCRYFFVTEFGGVLPISENNAGAQIQRLNWELGGLLNFTQRNAAGASFYFSLSKNSELYGGGKLRYRFWLNRSFSLDCGAGLMWRLNYIASGTNYTGHIGLNYRDIVSFIVQIDVLEDTITSLGIKTGSWIGAASGTAAAVGGTVLYILSRLE